MRCGTNFSFRCIGKSLNLPETDLPVGALDKILEFLVLDEVLDVLALYHLVCEVLCPLWLFGIVQELVCMLDNFLPCLGDSLDEMRHKFLLQMHRKVLEFARDWHCPHLLQGLKELFLNSCQLNCTLLQSLVCFP